MREFDDLVDLMDRLRGENGCPWDREQTPEDLRGYLLEEAYEVVEAIGGGQPEALEEELGDLLFQIVFLARIGSERGEFAMRDVVARVLAKMVRRHPHVFGDSTASTSEEVLRQWEEIKRGEKGDEGPRSAIDGVPKSLPSLLKAERLGAKASRVGFDWSSAEEVWPKVQEEVAELHEAVASGERERIAEEFGDVLFALVNLARHLGVHGESALANACERFSHRFRHLEAALQRRGSDPSRETLSELERLWREAKQS